MLPLWWSAVAHSSVKLCRVCNSGVSARPRARVVNGFIVAGCGDPPEL